jgi:hypothetical protein
MEAHPFSVSIGQATSRARMVSVGGATYRLRPAGHDARGATVALTNDAGGVAFVNDTHGHVVATAPVWLIPGQTVSAIPATCRSTAFDLVLLTPGVTGPDPVAVDLLWGVAGRGQAARDVDALAQLLCQGLASDPDHLRHPAPRELELYMRLLTDLGQQLDALAGQVPPLSASVGGIRPARASVGMSTTHATPAPSALSASPPDVRSRIRPPESALFAPVEQRQLARGGPVTPAVRARLRLAAAAAGRDNCGAGYQPVPPAADSSPVLELCSNGKNVQIENHSSAWAFLFPKGAPINAEKPAGIAAAQTVSIPSLQKLVGAVIHDQVVGTYTTGCQVLSWTDLCKPPRKPPKSEEAALLKVVKPGEGTTTPHDGYYAVAWGSGKGDRSALPPDAPLAEVEQLIRYSKTMSFVSNIVLPTVGLILDHQLKMNLAADQLPALLPIFKELADKSVELSRNGAPNTPDGQLRAIREVVAVLVNDAELLGQLLKALNESVYTAIEQLGTQLGEYLTGLEVPVVGWAVDAVKLFNKGSSFVALGLSVAEFFSATSKPTYSSWLRLPSPLDKLALPATPLSPGGGQPLSCPTPPKGHLPPGIPSHPRCLWVVKLDLDGNGSTDQLIVWQTATRRGAVGYLDDGSVHPLGPDPSAIRGTLAPWTRVFSTGDAAAPIAIYDLTGFGRHEVLLATATGVHGDEAVLVGLDRGGQLRLVGDGHGNIMALVTADSFGCAARGSQRLFVVTAAGAGTAGDTSRGSGTSHLYFTLSRDQQLYFAGYDGTVFSPTATGALDPLRNDCGTSIADARRIYPWASTPQQAVTGLLTAASTGDAQRAATFVGGAFADFAADNGEYQPDVWRYLTSISGASARQWIGRPVSCIQTVGRVHCQVKTTSGYGLFLDLENPGQTVNSATNWTVTGVFAGGG